MFTMFTKFTMFTARLFSDNSKSLIFPFFKELIQSRTSPVREPISQRLYFPVTSNQDKTQDSFEKIILLLQHKEIAAFLQPFPLIPALPQSNTGIVGSPVQLA